MRITTRSITTAAAALLLAACTDNSIGVTDAVSGSYSLTSISGFPLPFALADTLSISGGSITLNTDGTFSESLDFVLVNAGQTTTPNITCSGSVGQRGTNFDF